MEERGKHAAFGKPGIAPKWTQGNKDGVGTAYSGSSHLWFTIFRGVVTEVFYPTIDRPQLRDIQYMMTDGKTFVHEEKRHLVTRIERSDPHALSYRIINSQVEATVPFIRASCGYVAFSDGATDLNQNKQMDWEFDEALDGNVALTGELDLSGGWVFTTGVAFGHSLASAITSLFQSLAIPFEQHMERYVEQWRRPCKHLLPLDHVSGDGGHLYHGSYSLLLSHEDKTYPGAFIASLSIPWGEAKGDDDQGGYHVVWTRDLVNTATGLLAAGNNYPSTGVDLPRGQSTTRRPIPTELLDRRDTVLGRNPARRSGVPDSTRLATPAGKRASGF
jgi:GH15 family glucan-1,4-alpha-glucosidase